MTIRNEILEEITKLRTNVDGLLGYLDALDATLAPVESEPVVDKSWPQEGDLFYRKTNNGGIHYDTWPGGYEDGNSPPYGYGEGLLARGLAFETKEALEADDQLRLAMNELKMMGEKDGEKFGNDDRTVSYYAMFNHVLGEWKLGANHGTITPGVINFASPEGAIAAHKDVDAKYPGTIR